MENNKFRFIYKLIAPNDKVYIGQTIDLTLRLKYYYKLTEKTGQKLIYNSINKYGFENFAIEILFADYINQEGINALEEFYIKFYKDLNKSLNIADKAGLPNIQKGKDNYNAKSVYQCDLEGNIIKEWFCIKDIERELGIFHTNISHAINTNHFAFGFLWCKNEDYNKEKIINIYNGTPRKGDTLKKSIMKLDLDFNVLEIYSSISEASRKNNINKGNIDKCLAKTGSTAGGFYWIYKTNIANISEELIKSQRIRGKKIKCINLKSLEVIYFNSINEASLKLNLHRISITSVLRNKTKNPRKYDFKYE